MKPGDAVTVRFPSEPAVRDAGTAVEAVVERVRTDPAFEEYPIVVRWGEGVTRPVKKEWIAGAAPVAKQPGRRRST